MNAFSHRVLNVELTNQCMLRCPLCSTGSGFDTRAKGMMSFDDFARFFEQTQALFDTVAFVGSGEPLLHPRWQEFVRLVQRAGKRSECCSNGMACADARLVTEAGLSAIFFDLDGVTQTQHTRYRIGGDLAAVVDTITRVLRQRGKAALPRVYADTLLSRDNEKDYRRLIAFARARGVDGIRLRGLIDDLSGTATWSPRRIRFRQRRRQQEGHFDCLARHCVVGILSWNGDVQLCLMNPNREHGLVKMNAFGRDDLMQQFSSAAFLEATQRAGAYPFCRECHTRNFEAYYEMREFVV